MISIQIYKRLIFILLLRLKSLKKFKKKFLGFLISPEISLSPVLVKKRFFIINIHEYLLPIKLIWLSLTFSFQFLIAFTFVLHGLNDFESKFQQLIKNATTDATRPYYMNYVSNQFFFVSILLSDSTVYRTCRKAK